MVKRYICPTCRKVYKSKSNCQQTGCNVTIKDYKHTWSGYLMYIWGFSGLIMLFSGGAIGGSGNDVAGGALIIAAFFSIIGAVVLNIIDDRKIDKIANKDLVLMWGQPGPQPQFPSSPTYPSQTQPNQPPIPQYKCEVCGNIISWIQQYNRWYCQICRQYK
jgi:hypothetical protein